MNAVTGSEYDESLDRGYMVRRRGGALHISYDQAMEYLWPAEEGPQ